MQATIVMYHYVRPIKNSRFPGIKGLEASDFEEQVSYFKKHNAIVSLNDVYDAIYSGGALHPNALLLTFDDGYLDHYQYALPVLEKHKIKGCFYPPLCAVRERKMLSVNKIHFILSSAPAAEIAAFINQEIDKTGKPSARYLANLDLSSRFDTKEVIYVKRMLQRELPEDFREKLITQLFARYVSQDEKAFAEQLYLSEAQIKEMKSLGHHIGSHGSRHYWLSRLTSDEQRKDIAQTKDFLMGLGEQILSFCYPYGDYNDDTLNILKEFNFSIGLSTKLGAADLKGNPLTLARFDTNDFPKDKNAPAPR